MRPILRFVLAVALGVSAVLEFLNKNYQMGWIYFIALDVAMISWDITDIKELLFASQEEEPEEETSFLER